VSTDLTDDYTLLVYPFTHDLAETSRVERLRALATRWRPWWSRLEPARMIRALDDTYFFLPYVRELLFPETSSLRAAELVRQQSQLDELTSRSAASLAARVASDGVLHLTLDPAELAPLCDLQITLTRSGANGQPQHSSVAATVCWIDLYLFPQRVGFLVLKIRLADTPATIEQQLTLLELARPVFSPTVGRPLPVWRLRADATELTGRDLVDYLLQGLTAASPRLVVHTPAAYAARLRAGEPVPRYSLTSDGQVYGESFRLYSFVCLDLPAAYPVNPPFATPQQQLLYELASGRRATPGIPYEPHPEGLRSTLADHGIALWASWEALALPDRVCFLAHRSDDFNRYVLAHNVEADYFQLYLLTLYQKLRLSLLAGELQRRRTSLHDNLVDARALSRDFAMFRNHYWYAEVTLKAQGARIYERFQHGLGVSPLYLTISDEVRQLQEYYEAWAQRRTNTLLTFITIAGLLLAVPGLIAQVYGSAWAMSPWPVIVGWLGLIFAALGLLWLIGFVAVPGLYERRLGARARRDRSRTDA